MPIKWKKILANTRNLLKNFLINLGSIRKNLTRGLIRHTRSSLSEVLCWKGVLKICSKFTGEHPCGSAKQLYWNCTLVWVFSCKFAAYFQNTFSQEHLWIAAFDTPSVSWKKSKYVDFQRKTYNISLQRSCNAFDNKQITFLYQVMQDKIEAEHNRIVWMLHLNRI